MLTPWHGVVRYVPVLWLGLHRFFDRYAVDSVGELIASMESCNASCPADGVTGQADVAIAGITITPDREEMVDFAHGYFDSGLGVAWVDEHNPAPSAATAVVNALFSRFVLVVRERKQLRPECGLPSLTHLLARAHVHAHSAVPFVARS